MPYPKNIEQKLEFTQVKELVRQKCLSYLGASYLDKIRFVNRFDLLEKILLQVNEFKAILQADQPFPSDNYHHVLPFLNKANLEGAFLNEEEFFQLKQTLATFLNITKYFRDRTGFYPNLESLLEGLVYNDITIKKIDKIIDLEAKLRPNASPELARISSKLNEKEKEVRRIINRIYEKANDSGWLADSGITIRDGRLVLPVLAEYKKQIQGFVHDESNTGQTIYIEPTEVFEMNNLIRELQIAYKREREKILIELTSQIRPDVENIEKNVHRMGLYDFIRAKGLFALEVDGNMPMLSKHPVVKLYHAFHPILKYNHDKAGLKTIPLNIELSPEKHIMVISGPNAGGKSVSLKTVGLLQYMLQCGFLVSCMEHSEMGVFKELMVDIGDEQSIENDLSTYSSHLLHMKYFTDFANGQTLFLVDEFGTGTDPQFGGPLAEAILNQLKQKHAFGIVTTHYSNLKNYASNNKGLENACMLFDHDNLQPLYILEQGKPGSSYAFELATKSGLNPHILNYAKSRVGDKQKRVDEILIELEKEKKHALDIKQRFTEKEEKTNKILAEYEKLKSEIETNRKQLIKQAKMEALAIISEANSTIEATIREIKEKQADSDIQKQARTEIRKQITELKEFVAEEEKEIAIKTKSKIKSNAILEVGSYVNLDGQDVVGQVLELNKSKAVVAFGDIRTTINSNKLEVVDEPNASKKGTKTFSQGVDLNAKMSNFSTELNIIGKRGEEAMKELEFFMDDAFLLGMKQVRIVHGRGYGILRKLVHNYLKQNKHVEKIESEHADLGGDAVSIVSLKV